MSDEPTVIVNEGHKRECASNLRIAVTQGMTSGCVPTPWDHQSKPVYISLSPCNCGASQLAAQEVEPSAPAAEEQRLANLEHNRKFDEAVRAAEGQPKEFRTCGDDDPEGICLADDDWDCPTHGKVRRRAASGQAGAGPRYGDIAHKIVQAIYEKNCSTPTPIVEQILMDSFPAAPASQPSAAMPKKRERHMIPATGEFGLTAWDEGWNAAIDKMALSAPKAPAGQPVMCKCPYAEDQSQEWHQFGSLGCREGQ